MDVDRGKSVGHDGGNITSDNALASQDSVMVPPLTVSNAMVIDYLNR